MCVQTQRLATQSAHLTQMPSSTSTGIVERTCFFQELIAWARITSKYLSIKTYNNPQMYCLAYNQPDGIISTD
jgi:hypothetical protein